MTSLKQRAPLRVKQIGRRASVVVGERTASARMVPSFVLAGAQRCGTTSLFRALVAHPAILPAVHHKGVNYFDVSYGKGMRWYRGHFPVSATARLRARGADEPVQTFDASGYYLYHPLAIPRLAADLPGTKVLVMLRDPVERAFSAWKHETARGFETETFERALELEDERVEPELQRMLTDHDFQGFSHRHHSYRRRGQYAEQLDRVLEHVPRADLHVVDADDFFAEPGRETAAVLDFLGLSHRLPASFGKWNARPGSGLSDETRQRLREVYEPHDAALARLTGRVPSWRRQQDRLPSGAENG